jgi:hypothetical protein
MAVVLLALLPLTGCEDEEDESAILPIQAAVSVDPVTDDPALFLAESALDTDADDDVVFLDVMVRTGTAREFDAVNLQVRFDPGVLQFSGMTQTADADGMEYNPLGLCGSGPGDPTPPPAPTTGPLCQFNATSQPGNLFIGVAALPGLCDSYSRAGTVRLLTLSFVAASVGTSTIELVASGQTGDCEILNDLVDLGIPCRDGAAMVTASR